MSFPLVLHFGSYLPGDNLDAWQNYWNYWWTREALLSGRNPFWTPLLYAPYGVPLYLHTLNLFNGIVTLPVQLLFGVTAAYNSVVFLSFTLAGYFAYLLVSRVCGNRLAGFAGGVIYAFGSYQMAHLLGHANLIASEWLPAYIFCLIVASEATGRRRTLAAGAAVLALALVMLCDWQYVLFAVIFTVLYALWTAVARRAFTPLIVAGIIGACWLLVALPLLVPTIVETRETAATRPVVAGPERNSADLLSFFLPSPLHSWWGARVERLTGEAQALPVDRAIFLGYLPLALSFYGWWRNRRRAAFWAVAALVFFVLALGLTLQIAGRTQLGGLPLPYAWLHRLPLVSVSRIPARFALMVTLCLAVLSGFGLLGLAQRLAPLLARRPTLRAMLAAATIVGLLVEHITLPYPVQPVVEPPFYQQLARDAEAGTVLELPIRTTRSQSLYYQTVHRRPIVGGYISRPLRYPLLDLPPFAETPEAPRKRDITTPASPTLGRGALAFAGVRWIVVLTSDSKLNRATLPAFLERYAEPAPVYQDEWMTVYRPKPPGDPAFFLLAQPASGWHNQETLPDGRTPMRWFAWSATLDAWSLSDGPTPQAGVLRFDAWSFAQPRRLVVSVDGQDLGQWQIANPARCEIPLALTPGQHRVELRVLDAPLRPAKIGAGDDSRLLSIGVANVDLRGGAAPAPGNCTPR